MDRETYFGVGLFLGAIITICVAFNLVETRYDIIAHHAAHFDGQTGKFTWNDEV